jgi:ABC-type lipoprotein release transport system permease subunit
VENVSPRVETFAMASLGLVSKGIAVIGVSPEKEAQKSNLPSRIVQGEYLSETDNGILIGEGLSKYLKASVGDTMALIGQGYQGSNAAQLFIVRGILKLMMPEMDYGMAYITLSAAQQFIDMPDGYSGILISIKEDKLLTETIQNVEKIVDTQTLAVYSWHFTMEKLLQTAKSDRAFSLILMFILYVIVGFGILGTVIMMTNERRREFCMLISLGMARMKLVAVIAFELIFMTLIGLMLALVVTLLITHWFAAHPIALSGSYGEMFVQFGMEPILPMSVESFIYTNQMINILIISLLAVIYPVNKILRLKITNKN